MVLAQDATVLFFNDAARRILERNDGIRLRQQRLTTSEQRDQVRFTSLIAAALGQFGELGRGGGIGIDRVDGRALIVRALPLPRDLRPVWPKAAALVLITDPDEPAALEPEVLRELDLTRAEARLAGALLEGKDVASFAATAGLSEQTARWTLKQVLTKTGTHRQAELVAYLQRMVRP